MSLDVAEVLVLGPVGEAHLHGVLVQRGELLGLQKTASQLFVRQLTLDGLDKLRKGLKIKGLEGARGQRPPWVVVGWGEHAHAQVGCCAHFPKPATSSWSHCQSKVFAGNVFF